MRDCRRRVVPSSTRASPAGWKLEKRRSATTRSSAITSSRRTVTVRRSATRKNVWDGTRPGASAAPAWHVLAEVHNNVGGTSLMGRAAERSMEYARRAGDRRQLVMSLRLLVGALVYGPTPAQEGLRLAEHHRAVAEESRERVAEAVVLFGVAAFHAMLEHYD